MSAHQTRVRPRDLQIAQQPTRQQAYLNAIATLPRIEAHLGTFMNSVVSQVIADSDPATVRYRTASGKPVIKLDAVGAPEKVWTFKSEEKGSDVNLAAHLRAMHTGEPAPARSSCPTTPTFSPQSEWPRLTAA